jgi:phage-related protein
MPKLTTSFAIYTRTGIERPKREDLYIGRIPRKRISRNSLSLCIAVQKGMGVALYLAQLGGMPESAKPWKGNGSGVYELVDDHRGDTFRAVYTVRIGDAVHVLHAFQKKVQVGHCDTAA